MNYSEIFDEVRRTPFGIFVNQAGYLPDGIKTAVMPFECKSFSVVNSDGKAVFEGSTEHFGFDTASGDDVYKADFSALSENGIYHIEADGKRSASFEISSSPYDKLFFDVSKAFYYLRCGCALEKKYAGEYVHEKCHSMPAMLWEDHSVTCEASGGWHDAGDYGRYVTAGACALSHLLYAYKLFPDVFEKLDLNIPESGSGVPDILSECRVELEWMLKMQRSDGAVYHKATTAHHAPFIMPEEDKAQMYLLPISSMAAADLAAVCALASGIYRCFDSDFSDKLRTAAELSYKWLSSNPFIGFTNPEGCGTGCYGERDDNSNRFWAASELYALTGEKSYYSDVNKTLEENFPIAALGYGEVGGFGALALMTTEFDVESVVSDRMKKAFTDEAARLADVSDRSGYDVSMRESDYYWGSMMNLLKQGMVFGIAEKLCGMSGCRKYAFRQLDFLMGRNALGISFVTGNGEFRCNYPHLRPAFADGIEECIPGMVSGGPNGRPADGVAVKLVPEGTPPMKCYVDHVGSYSMNEITIYWNSPAVFMLAYLLDK